MAEIFPLTMIGGVPTLAGVGDTLASSLIPKEESNVPIGYKEQRLVVNKANLANAAAGQMHSLWLTTGFPAAADIPTTTPVVCTRSTLGALTFDNATVETKSYLGSINIVSSISGSRVVVEDRLAHMAGLSGTVTTAQAVNLSATISGLSVNRIGATNYSYLNWFMEWYTDTGATAVTATVNVTYSDNSTGNLSAISLAATRRASFRVHLNYYIPPASAHLYIKTVNTVQLSNSTGTAGNFGVTLSRNITSIGALVANYSFDLLYAPAQMPDVQNDACLSFMVMPATINTGGLTADIQLVQKASTVGSVFNRQEFTAAGTFTVPDGVTEILLSGTASGGDGGSSNGGAVGAAGGGSSGEWILRKKFTVTPGSTHTVTSPVSGDTSFGALQTLRQGYGGASGSATEGIFDAAVGGYASWGDSGGAGGVGFDAGFAGTTFAHHAPGGNGGSTPFGAGGAGGQSFNPGLPGRGYGSGGGGDGGGLAISPFSNTGAPGIWIVEW